ncbi:hypothetical protein KAU09_03440 [Candidatus Parcubacteria bacterium]|nr:hypothetical protein [Candidatus Parcubacteria bacterium]
MTSAGFVEGFLNLHEPGKPTLTMTTEERAERQIALYGFAKEKVRQAKNLAEAGEVYSPYHYFRDLAIFSDKQKELELDAVVNLNYFHQLMYLARQSLDNGYNEYDVKIAREKYKKHIDPAKEARDEAFATIRQMGINGILDWCFLLYFKTLPLALLLYLIWLNEDKKRNKNFCFRSPLSFVLALIAYPFVAAYIFFKWLQYSERRIWAEAELRRTKNKIFTFLSDDEIGQIKDFAKSSLSVICWRKQFLAQGLFLKHGLVKAVIAALVMSFLMLLLPRATVIASSKKKVCDTEIIAEQLGQNLARMYIEKDETNNQNDWIDKDLLHEFLLFDFRLTARVFSWVLNYLGIQEFVKNIDHIPITAVWPRVNFLNNPN